jgi:hypothetical protein
MHAEHEPYCLAMVLCDGVHRDPATGKFTLLGTFHAIRASEFPTGIRMVVYFVLTDIIGAHKIRLNVVDASMHLDGDPPEPILTHETDMTVEDPLMVVEGVMGIQLSLPGSGVYHVELYAGDSPLMTRRLTVLGPPSKEQPS